VRKLISSGFTLGAVLCAVGLAAAQSSMSGSSMKSMGGSMSGSSMMHSFKISPQNGSGESGVATLTQSGGSLVVKLALTGASGQQPAHIHKGTCAKLNPAPAYPLTTVSGGASTTTLKTVTLSQLTSGTYAINVHKSTTDIKDYVACGNLTVASTK
jgi:hypothetical protein